jgi:hypothetical protein
MTEMFVYSFLIFLSIFHFKYIVGFHPFLDDEAFLGVAQMYNLKTNQSDGNVYFQQVEFIDSQQTPHHLMLISGTIQGLYSVGDHGFHILQVSNNNSRDNNVK